MMSDDAGADLRFLWQLGSLAIALDWNPMGSESGFCNFSGGRQII
jgi:hypothetical protein